MFDEHTPENDTILKERKDKAFSFASDGVFREIDLFSFNIRYLLFPLYFFTLRSSEQAAQTENN